MKNIVCYNRDQDGKCLAYNHGVCQEDCPARIKSAAHQVELLNCLIQNTPSKKDQRKLEDERRRVCQALYLEEQGKYEDWMSCYYQDTHRGEKGGASESDSNRATSLKQLMKDNRPVGVKPTKAQQEEYKAALQEWEAQNEKLERLGRSGTTHRKVDSYTGVPICFLDNGTGTCNGSRSSKGMLNKDCKVCSKLKPGTE